MRHPASTSISLKVFLPFNMGTATAGNKCYTLADGEATINVGKLLKEIVHMEELKHAVRTSQPGHGHGSALESFHRWLHNSNYGLADLNKRLDRVFLLVDGLSFSFSDFYIVPQKIQFPLEWDFSIGQLNN
jgi:hypothetical protein